MMSSTTDGSLDKVAELAREFAFYPRHAMAIQQYESKLGDFARPAAPIRESWAVTRYPYRVEFGEYSALTFLITIDKTTNLIDGIGITPAE
jgi:hypothetical protein